MPSRLDANYIDSKGNKIAPVMIHRAILGSLERFVGILIEEYSGNLPLWLSPVHVTILNITENQKSYCLEILKILKKSKIRSNMDLRNEKIGYKIIEHTMLRSPYLLVVGDKELENGKISVRTRLGDDLGEMSVENLIKMIETLVDKRSINLTI